VAMKGKKWKPDAAFISKKKLEKEDETHADGIDLKQQAKDQTFFQGTTKSGEELAAIESELDKTAQWEAELKAKQDALLAERNKALQDDINTKARRKKERYQRLWGPILILYPTFHAGLAIFTIFMGNIILNSTCEEGTTRDQEDAAESSGCSAPLDVFIGAAIAVSYIFMFFFTWVLIGPRPIRSFKTLFVAYGILFGLSFLVYGAGTAFVLLGDDCAESTPGLYYLSYGLMVIYWISAVGFVTFALYTHIRYRQMVRREAAEEDAAIEGKRKEVEDKRDAEETRLKEEQAARDVEFGSSSSEEDDDGSNVPKHQRGKGRKVVRQKGESTPSTVPPPPSSAPPPE